MKKLILLCFPAKLSPFPNRSSLPLPNMTSYLPENDGVSHRLSRFISQTKGLPISQAESLPISKTEGLNISPAAGWHISQAFGLYISQTKGLPISQTQGLHISIKRFFHYILATFFLFLFLIGAPTIVKCQVAFSPREELSSPSFHPRQKEYSPSAFGEKSLGSDSLKVGDYLPADLVVNTLSDAGTKPLLVRDLRGKYVVLEFWATWCSASSASLYQVDELQQKFASDIQFIPVTYESKEKVKAKLDAFPSMASLSLPLVVDEKGLGRLFPHITLPHLVILDREGRIMAVTGKEDLTEEKLERLIRTGVASFRTKVDKRMKLSLAENLISGNHQIPSKNIRFQSALTSYIPEVSGTLMDDRENGAHILAVNRTLLSLYRFAYSARDFANYIGMNRVVLIGFGEEELDSPKTGLDYIAWQEEGDHVFGYELITPPGVDQYQIMREDLDRYFPGIDAKLETRKRKVWVLRLPEGEHYPSSSYEQASYSFSPVEASIRNYPLIGLLYQLNQTTLQRSPYPLIDLTGIDYPIDLDIQGNFSKPEDLKVAFEKAGFILELSEEEIPVLVLNKVSNSIFGDL